MSKFKDTKATKGGNWTEALVFYTGSETHHFSHYHLTEEMSAHEGIDRSEILQKMWLYKRPLTEWQLTQLVCNHQFVVIDSSRWYRDIERETVKNFSFKGTNGYPWLKIMKEDAPDPNQ